MAVLWGKMSQNGQKSIFEQIYQPFLSAFLLWRTMGSSNLYDSHDYIRGFIENFPQNHITRIYLPLSVSSPQLSRYKSI